MPFKYKLTSLTFKDEHETKIESIKNITVFVGPNNAGKSTSLKEILDFITSGENKETNVIIKDIHQTTPSSYKELESSYNLIQTPLGSLSYAYQTLEPSPIKSGSGAPFSLNSTKKISDFNKYAGKALVMYLNTEDRLSLVKRQDGIKKDRLHRSPETVLELFDGKAKELKQVKDYFKKLFSEDVELFSGNNGSIYFMMGSPDKTSKPNTMNQKELEEYDKDTPHFDDQGDGMKSSLGILCSIIGSNKPIVLIDEPEAFLHPPQAYQMGKIINEISKKYPGKQFFISTHNSDFLRGLLSSPSEVGITYLARGQSNKMDVTLLSKNLLKEAVKDPFLSSINVLNGFFYNGTIIVEGETDRIFYNSAFEQLYSGKQVSFLETGGKNSFAKVTDFLTRANVKYAIIADVDILLNDNPSDFERLISSIIGKNNEDALKPYIDSRQTILNKVYAQGDKTINLNSLDQSLDEVVRLLSNTSEINENKEKIQESIKKLANIVPPLRKIYTSFRDQGINYFSDKTNQEKFNYLLDLCNSIGLFPVPIGQLESWYDVFDESGTPIRKKNEWIIPALNTLSSQLDTNASLKNFVNKIGSYLGLDK